MTTTSSPWQKNYIWQVSRLAVVKVFVVKVKVLIVENIFEMPLFTHLQWKQNLPI